MFGISTELFYIVGWPSEALLEHALHYKSELINDPNEYSRIPTPTHTSRAPSARWSFTRVLRGRFKEGIPTYQHANSNRTRDSVGLPPIQLNCTTYTLFQPALENSIQNVWKMQIYPALGNLTPYKRFLRLRYILQMIRCYWKCEIVWLA